MRRQALDRKRTRDANLFLVVVGFVVEVLEIGFGGDTLRFEGSYP
jgi:hypothetical protein